MNVRTLDPDSRSEILAGFRAARGSGGCNCINCRGRGTLSSFTRQILGLQGGYGGYGGYGYDSDPDGYDSEDEW